MNIEPLELNTQDLAKIFSDAADFLRKHEPQVKPNKVVISGYYANKIKVLTGEEPTFEPTDMVVVDYPLVADPFK